MKTFIVFALFVAAAVAYPGNPGDRDAQVLVYENDNIGTPDGYHTRFETSNGISGNQEASVSNPGTDNEALTVRGSYSYIGDDGQTYKVDYTADENGYHPSAPFLPK